MASLRTVVRELGVIYWTDRILNDKVKPINQVKPEEVYEICETYLTESEINEAQKLKDKDNFTTRKEKIMERNYWLSLRLIDVLGIDEIKTLSWVGPKTQDGSPIDITINSERISLKENSYLLENTGLYQYINLMTDSSYKPGDWHIFKDFAEEEYQEWFDVSWGFLVDQAKSEKGIIWSDDSRNYRRKIESTEDEIKIMYKEREAKFPKESISIETYEDRTISDLRKVFGKWIREVFLSDQASNQEQKEYIHKKRDCAEEAGENLIEFIDKNRDVQYKNLLRYLQVYDKSYYYAKSADGESKIYKVNSLENFEYEKLSIEEIRKQIPESQLNIRTVVNNNETEKELELENQVRFSHKQFNGTPEAKLYLVRGYSLEAVYNKIDQFSYKNRSILDSKSQGTLQHF